MAPPRADVRGGLTIFRDLRPGRKAFTAVELLTVLLAGALLVGIFGPALLRLRDGSNRAVCANNLRQIALAARKFHDTNGTLPPYWGAYPKQESLSIKGSWFCHLLPYVGETELYGRVTAEIQRTGTNWDGDQLHASQERTTEEPAPATTESGGRVLTEMARYNGHSHWEWFLAGAAAPSEHAVERAKQQSTAAGGIFIPEFAAKSFPLLVCPSDPSPGSYPDAGAGRVYLTREQPWGSTNYLANWHAFANNNPHSGYRTPPQSLGTFTNGTANTVLFGEGYAWCDGKGRLALNSWDYHSFGLTWPLPDSVLDDGEGPRRVQFPNGMPNTYLFQVRPLPKETPDCPEGSDCCDNWRSQTGHSAMNAAMADGSVRDFAAGMSQSAWDAALKPRDGPPRPWEW